jgi:hypothetical protein
MLWLTTLVLAGMALCCICAAVSMGATKGDGEWTLLVGNDNCPDYTWRFNEKQTRKAFADIVRAHLEEVGKTDSLPPESRNRYNMAVTQEMLCFLEYYPDQEKELVRRILEGRIYVSPFVCNNLWAFNSVESFIRTLYPARRLERKYGIPFQVAEHIEQPALPWGAITILAGCGVRWLSVPFLKYDTTFTELKNPPVFILEGPDGAKVRVILDRWACLRAGYWQGGRLLRDVDAEVPQWVRHYQGVAGLRELRACFLSGTHSDYTPHSGDMAPHFARAIAEYNARPDRKAKLVNATLPQFCEVVDAKQKRKGFLKTLRGCFGHGWDVWPICLAKYAAAMRRTEQQYMAAETLVALAGQADPRLHEETRAAREEAEWFWAMLPDHAWNGTDPGNKRHNAILRRRWCKNLATASRKLTARSWEGMALKRTTGRVTLFNSLSFARRGLARLTGSSQTRAVEFGESVFPTQAVKEDGKTALYFVPPEIPAFSHATGRVRRSEAPAVAELQATSTVLDGPFYRVEVDRKAGGVTRLVHKPSGRQLVSRREALARTVYNDGRDHPIKNIRTRLESVGPVLARLSFSGSGGGVKTTTFVTLYAELDRVDFDVRVHRSMTTREDGLFQYFPVLDAKGVIRLDTTGAVIRPHRKPQGDLLAGADLRRFAVQGFVNRTAPSGVSVTVSPLDAFTLRRDRGDIVFEAFGSDENYREVTQDQAGETEFRFAYSLCAGADGYDPAGCFVWSRDVARPLVVTKGESTSAPLAPVGEVDPRRAIATCLKPADGDAAGGVILRLREIAGRSGPLAILVPGFRKAMQTDLLERDLRALSVKGGKVRINLPAHGLASLRLLG